MAAQPIQSEPVQAGEAAPVRFRRTMLRRAIVVVLVFGVAVVLTLAWWSSKPGNTSIPADLPEVEKQEIVSLLHHFTISHAFSALRSGNAREFVRALLIARRQGVSQFRDNHDGTFRVYTVVEDPKEKDGWYAWSRHYMQKTNGHWVITRSY